MRVTIQLFLLAILIAALAYVFQPYIRTTVSQVYQRLAPCSQPITYKIGSIDPRFGVATSTFVADIKTAAGIWSEVHNKTLFAYDADNGVVTINFVYDTRQEVSQKLNSLDATIQNTKSQYNALKAQYTAAANSLSQKRALFESKVTALNKREAAYESEVKMWNTRGGASGNVFSQLQAEQTSLNQAESQLKQEQNALNAQVDSVNVLNDKLNTVISGLNNNATSYNATNQAEGSFEEGVYIAQSGKQEIDIYEYANQTKLLRVLAHELGHALGLDHVTDPQAIMYEQNSGKGLAATAADITALDAICHR